MEKSKISDYLKDSVGLVSTLIDTSKIIGKPLIISPSKALIPISKVSFGLGTGSGKVERNENKNNKKFKEEYSSDLSPNLGASLIGVNMVPEAFLLIEEGKTSIIYMERDDTLFEKLLSIYKTIKK
ncbi:MAG: GerW family sporulation protein [Bacilli bacterium]